MYISTVMTSVPVTYLLHNAYVDTPKSVEVMSKIHDDHKSMDKCALKLLEICIKIPVKHYQNSVLQVSEHNVSFNIKCMRINTRAYTVDTITPLCQYLYDWYSCGSRTYFSKPYMV